MRLRTCLESGDSTQRLERELLLMHVLGQNRAWLYTHDDHILDAETLTRYQALLDQRRQGLPIAYLTGSRSFWEHTFQVNEHCLIPRADTERLVEVALERLPEDWSGSLIDLGTGSGIIAISLSLSRPAAHVIATDINPDALKTARENADQLGATGIEFVVSDWFTALDDRRFDLIVSNPPYIRSEDPHLDQGDLRFEPSLALDGGDDGLDAYRRIILACPKHLADGGHLLLEHGHDQRDALSELLHDAGFGTVLTYDDLAGNPRVILATAPSVA